MGTINTVNDAPHVKVSYNDFVTIYLGFERIFLLQTYGPVVPIEICCIGEDLDGKQFASRTPLPARSTCGLLHIMKSYSCQLIYNMRLDLMCLLIWRMSRTKQHNTQDDRSGKNPLDLSIPTCFTFVDAKFMVTNKEARP